jgi:hypothetical protein
MPAVLPPFTPPHDRDTDDPDDAVAPRIAAATEWVVEFSRHNAHAVVAVCLVLAALFGWYTATHWKIDASTDHLIDPTLPWRQAEAEMARLFPQNEDTLVIVVDGVTPELADDAAGRLAKRLATRPDMFMSLRRPDASEFFRRNGLLFLPTKEVSSANALPGQPLMARSPAIPASTACSAPSTWRSRAPPTVSSTRRARPLLHASPTACGRASRPARRSLAAAADGTQ